MFFGAWNFVFVVGRDAYKINKYLKSLGVLWKFMGTFTCKVDFIRRFF
jgi:hypothetical protein